MKKLILIALLLILTGCSNKLVYNNLDWLVHWYLDDYIEFTPEQKVIFDKKFAGWLDWHKTNELPQYQASLNDLATDISKQQLNAERLNSHLQAIEQHWQRIKIKLAPDLAEMAPMLSQQQILELFQELDNTNAKEREKIEQLNALSPEKRQRKTVERYQENFESWIGPPNPEQKTLTETLYEQFEANDLLWLQYRQRYQAELKALLLSPNKGPEFNQQLQQLIINPEQFRDQQFNQAHTHNNAVFNDFLLQVEASLTEEQRQHLVTEINALASDTEKLMTK